MITDVLAEYVPLGEEADLVSGLLPYLLDPFYDSWYYGSMRSDVVDLLQMVATVEIVEGVETLVPLELDAATYVQSVNAAARILKNIT